MIDLTPVFNAIITLMAALITAFVIPWLKRKISAEKMAEIKKWTKIAVEAAEMIFKGSNLGQTKKAYVSNYLKEKGYTLDEDSIEALIESTVLEMKIEAGWS